MSTFSTNIKDALIIVRKELRAYACSPIAYIVAVLFVGVAQFLFFASASVLLEASVAGFMYLIPWLFVLVVPALTMGLVAAEHDSGTYELLATRPITDGALIAGKFVGVLAYLALVCVLALAPVAVSLSFFGDLDVGVTVAAFLAALFLSSVFASIGLAISAFLGKQVSALLSSVAVSFVLVIVGYEFVTQLVPPSVAHLFERLSVLSHYMNVARGVLDVADVWYFVSVTLAALTLAHYRLIALRMPRRHTARRRALIVTALLIATVAVSNVLGSALPGRLDLTERGKYTLSEPTVQTLEALPDVVALTLYASAALPAQYRAIERDTRDILRDYVRYGNGNVTLAVKDPSESDTLAEEAERAGIAPIQFNTVGEGALSVQKGYLGIIISYAGTSYPIAFVQDTGSLEYELTSTLVRLTRTEKKKVRFVSGAGGQTGDTFMRTLSQELANEYDVATLDVSSTTAAIDTRVDVLILGSVSRPFEESETTLITQYLESGGSILALLSGVVLDEQSLIAAPLSSLATGVFSRYGVSVEPDLVYDLQASEVVQLRANTGGSYLVAYPWWLRAVANPEHPSTREVRDLFMPWSSSLTLEQDIASTSGYSLAPLVATSPYAGTARDTFALEPGAAPPQSEQKERIVGVALEKTEGTTSRAIVLGSARVFNDESLQNNQNNLAAALSMVGYLAQEASLAGIKTKASGRSPLTLPSPTVWPILMYGNIAFGVLVPTVVGALVLVRRRKRASHVYEQADTVL